MGENRENKGDDMNRELPPRDQYMTIDGVKYHLRRPSYGARNKFVKDMGIQYDDLGRPLNTDQNQLLEKMFYDLVLLCLVEPKLTKEQLMELDTLTGDMLFRAAQNMMQLTALSGPMGSDIKKP